MSLSSLQKGIVNIYKTVYAMILPASAQTLYEVTCEILHRTFQLKNKTNNPRTKVVLF